MAFASCYCFDNSLYGLRMYQRGCGRGVPAVFYLSLVPIFGYIMAAGYVCAYMQCIFSDIPDIRKERREKLRSELKKYKNKKS